MNITIRKAVENDFGDILSLLKAFASFQKTPHKVMTTVEQMKKDKEIFQCLVAETDQQVIIGFATFFFAYYSWTGKALYLDDLYVSEPCRGQKIGSMLLEEIIHIAKSSGCRKMRWQVSNWNQHAIEFYKKLGATIDEVEINCDLEFGT